MKVYIITKEPFPNGMAATGRIKCYAKALKLADIECEILICTRTEVYGKEIKNTEGTGDFEGILFRYIGNTPLRARNIFRRKLNDWMDKERTLSYLRKHLRPKDVVLFFFTQDVRYILRLIKMIHKKSATCTCDLGELPYGTKAETKFAVHNRSITLHKQFPGMDGILPISHSLAELARAHAHTDCVINIVPIMVDYKQYESKYYSDNKEIPYIYHAGTLYEQKDGILGMIEAFGIALQRSKKEFYFVCTGKMDQSPHSKEIQQLIRKYHLEDKFVFTGYLNEEELKQYHCKAALAIINKYRTQQNRYCFSSKLGEYLAAGIPVIITRYGEAMRFLKDGSSAYIVEPEDVEALAEKIVYAIEHLDERKSIGKNGQIVCRRYFDYPIYADLLKCHIAKLSVKSSVSQKGRDYWDLVHTLLFD